MSFATLATIIHPESGLNPGFHAAIDLARQLGAHLDVFALGIESVDVGYYHAGVHAMAISESLSTVRAEAEEVAELARKHLQGDALRWEVEPYVVQSSGLIDFVAERTRYSELVVLEKPYGGPGEWYQVPTLEAIMFGSRVPLLVVPEGARPQVRNQKILIGWNESDEAMRAVRDALPFLREAEEVQVVVIDPPRHGAGRSDPGGALAAYLSRQGVSCEVAVLAKTESSTAEILARRANEVGAGMIVMGAYGHTRLREAIVGGATRHMLERVPVPVFMSR